MKTLVLHGSLRREFGDRFRIAVTSPAQAIRLMDVNFPGRFRKALEGQMFLMTTAPGQKTPGCRRLVTEQRLWMSVGHEEIHIRPIVAGRIKGLFAGLAGVPAVGGFFGGFLGGGLGAAPGGLFGLGAGGALGGFGPILLGVTLLGISMLLSKSQKPKDKDEKKSFLFDGPVNSFEQGGPVPLVYGKVRVGSTVISGGLEVAQRK